MTKGRAETRRRRLHRGDAGHDANIEITPLARAVVDRLEHGGRHCEDAGIAAGHNRDDAAFRNARERLPRAIDLDAIVACNPRLPGALRNARHIGRVADDVLRFGESFLRLLREPARVSGPQSNDIHASGHGRRPCPGIRTIEK